MKIKIHSFVDLVTNSSTETYVCATEKTMETVKELLGMFVGKNNVDAMFDFYFSYESYDSKEELIQDGVNPEDILSESKWGECEVKVADPSDAPENSHVELNIKPKVELSEDGKKVLELLSGLIDTYEIEAYYS